MNGESLNIEKENIKRLVELFPEINTDGKIDFDKLKQILGDYVDDSEERYRFVWNGKGEALRISQTPSTGTLRPDKESSKHWDTTENLYIEGDNLEVLKLLQKSYFGKVKMIYIDPPYNTGNDLVYPDDYKDSLENYKKLTGQVDSQGNATTTNREYSGRYHTDWLNMMYPRLRLARNLLKEDGVIFISIDDHEVHNMRKICDEIFGENNFVACMVWHQGRKSSSKYIAINHEYCLVYCKDKKSDEFLYNNKFYWKEKKQGLNVIYRKVDELKKKYQDDYEKMSTELVKFYNQLEKDSPILEHRHYNKIDKRGVYFAADASAPDKPETRSHKPLIHPVTNKETPTPRLGWRYNEDTLMKLYEENRFHFGKDETTIPCIKRYLHETEYEVANSVFYKDGRGASNRLDRLMEKRVFNFPKDEGILKKFINLCIKKDRKEIILDFFSGSSTTAHAVMDLNAEDGGNRKFIMVQLPEPTDEKSEAYKAGYKNIAEIGKERIRRAGEQIKDELKEKYEKATEEERKNMKHPDELDIGFRTFKLDTSNIKEWNPGKYENIQAAIEDFETPYVPGRSEEDVVYEMMLKIGLDLTLPIEEIKVNRKTIYSIGYGLLMICLDENIDQAVAQKMIEIKNQNHLDEFRVIFRDEGFASDTDKTNIKETLRSAGLAEESFITL